jgi:DNA-binding response OmpR family regulator
MKVLIVDDEYANRELLSWLLEEEHHQVIKAADGREALELFEKEKPDLVLLDIMMPIMDGFQTAKIIKRQTAHRHIPIIFLTALTDKDALAQGLASGGDDFLVKPFNETILKAKIKAHTRTKELSDLLAHKNKELTHYKNIMEHERDIAEHVFKAALKKNALKHEHIEYYIAPASTFNGDLLLATPSPSGSMYYVMADFTGHGLPAAIGAIPMSQRFFELASNGHNIGYIAKKINQSLLDIMPDNMFCAATIVEQRPNGQELIIWTGGLPDAYIVSDQGDIIHKIRSQHMPLGVLNDDEFEQHVQLYRMENKASFFIYTDGLTESANDRDQLFGEERLCNLLQQDQWKLDSIIDKHTQFIGTTKPDDDVTLIRIKAMPLPALNESEQAALKPFTMPWKISSRMNANAFKKHGGRLRSPKNQNPKRGCQLRQRFNTSEVLLRKPHIQ